MPQWIKKRDGRTVEYDEGKIAAAILRAFEATDSAKGEEEARRLARRVTREINGDESIDLPTVEAEMLHHYTLSDDDLEIIRARRRPHNRFGFALERRE